MPSHESARKNGAHIYLVGGGSASLAADGLHGWAGSLRAEADRIAAKIGESPDGDTYVWLRTHCEAARAETDATTLVALSDQIAKKVEKKRRTITAAKAAPRA